MLDRRKTDGRRRTERFGNVMEDRVGRFRRARRKHDLRRVTAKEYRQFLPRRLQRQIGSLPDPMRAGWIADIPLRRFEPRLTSRRQKRRRRIVVEVNHVGSIRTTRGVRSLFAVRPLDR